MKSNEPVIPAILTNSQDVFRQRIEFAKDVADAVHIDVTDGIWDSVPTLEIEQWPSFTLQYVEAHLMVKHPLPYFPRLKKAGVVRAIVHVESFFDLDELAARAKEADLLLGFAVNPDTDLEDVLPFFEVSNYVQIMGIEPGRTGQPYIPQTPLAISYFKRQPNRRLILSVDGGISEQNILELSSAGASYFVCSTALYGSGDWKNNYNHLIGLLEHDN